MQSGGGGQWETVTGAYFIADPGYLKWRAIQAPSSSFSSPSYLKWKKQMESVRKDIECIFGRVKNRFRILKTPVMYHDKNSVDNIVFTCFALHNIILDWDLETNQLEDWDIDLSTFGEFADEEGEDAQARYWVRPKLTKPNHQGTFTPDATTDFSDIGVRAFPTPLHGTQGQLADPDPSAEIAKDQPGAHLSLQMKLVEHFKYFQPTWLRS